LIISQMQIIAVSAFITGKIPGNLRRGFHPLQPEIIRRFLGNRQQDPAVRLLILWNS
jgi:hypothetical protein